MINPCFKANHCYQNVGHDGPCSSDLRTPADVLKRSMAFEEAWAKKVDEGYQYGLNAIEQIRFGWELRDAEVSKLKSAIGAAKIAGVRDTLEILERCAMRAPLSAPLFALLLGPDMLNELRNLDAATI